MGRKWTEEEKRKASIKRSVPLAERFWQYVNKTEDCWEWTGACIRGGYGYIKTAKGQSNVYAHRYSFELSNGYLPPKGMHVCHTCNNRKCVRPEHLYCGTPKENSADRIAAGTLVLGEDHVNSKLTEAAVREIRLSEETGITLAGKFGVSPATISMIRNRKVWAHLKD